MSISMSISSEVRERYAHYKQVRFSSTLLPDGTSSWQIQGWNGKKWVRAKARKGISSRRPKKGYVYAVL